MPMLRQILIPLLCGLVFGIGLALSGMTDTQVVLGFLDIGGEWNPALLMVMIGALAVTIPGFWLAQKRATPFFSTQFFLPASRADRGEAADRFGDLRHRLGPVRLLSRSGARRIEQLRLAAAAVRGGDGCGCLPGEVLQREASRPGLSG